MSDWIERDGKKYFEEGYLQSELAAVREEAAFVHHWFAKHFGEVVNGRDFPVKCAMADRELSRLRKIEEVAWGIKGHWRECWPLSERGCTCGYDALQKALEGE